MRGAFHIRLASASPRRQELLSLTGWKANVQPVAIDEIIREEEDPQSFARRLALEKAEAAAKKFPNSDIILAADTIVVYRNRILGKPVDENHAGKILQELCGKTHRVITALVLIDQAQNQNHLDMCETEVPMRTYTIGEIDDYVASGKPMDKAGAYGIQDGSFNPVITETMIGCFANVMGLPICHLVRSMGKLGITPVEDVPTKCMAHTGYDCTVYTEVLNYKR